MISVCIVTNGRAGHISRCLDALRHQEAPPAWELAIAVDGDPSLGSAVDRYWPVPVVVLHTSGLTLGENRNRLLDRVSGEIVLFLDDDVIAPPRLLADLADLAEAHPEVGVFGGPNLTPEGAPRFEHVQGALLADPFLTGRVSRRYRPVNGTRATGGSGLTLCNLAVRRSLHVAFPEGQRGGEESSLLADLRSRRVRMLVSDDLAVAHARRSTLGQFARQMHKYGYGRGEVIASASRWPSLLPVAAVLGGTVAWSARRRGACALAMVVAVWWRAAAQASPDGEVRPDDVAQAALLPTSYGVGVLSGLVGGVRRQRGAAGRSRIG